jgi:hypothetical protein
VLPYPIKNVLIPSDYRMREIASSADGKSSVNISQDSNKIYRRGFSINAEANVQNYSAVQQSAKAVAHAVLKDLGRNEIKGPRAKVPRPPTVKDERLIHVTLEHIVFTLCMFGLILSLLIIKLISPSPWMLTLFTVVGMGMGLAFSFLYCQNLKSKSDVNNVVSLISTCRAPRITFEGNCNDVLYLLNN